MKLPPAGIFLTSAGSKLHQREMRAFAQDDCAAMRALQNSAWNGIHDPCRSALSKIAAR